MLRFLLLLEHLTLFVLLLHGLLQVTIVVFLRFVELARGEALVADELFILLARGSLLLMVF